MSDAATASDPSAASASTGDAAPAMAAADDDGGSHGGSLINYWAIFYVLCGLTLLSWLLDESKGWGIIRSHVLLSALVLAVATAKALFVLGYFMHLKFEGRWKYVLLAPTLILAAGLPLALAPDLSFQYYPADTAQTRYLRRTAEADAAGAPYAEGIADGADDAPAAEATGNVEPPDADATTDATADAPADDANDADVPAAE